MRIRLINVFFIILALGILAGGCVSIRGEDREQNVKPAAELSGARKLYEQGKYTEAMIACTELARRDPLMPGLPELERSIINKLNERRGETAAARAEPAHERMELDVSERKALPDSYGMRRRTQVETPGVKTPPGAMEEVLRKNVTVILPMGAGLPELIDALRQDEGVPIIGSLENIASTPMAINAVDVPLGEILEYISRNMGVQFYLGERLIWVVPGQAGGQGEPRIPMETRMYRLRKGAPGIKVSTSEEVTEMDEDYERHSRLLDAIGRFVPQPESADFLFDRNTHVLVVRNTRANLHKLEEILEAIDVTPPQILIEARFITTAVSDLRELGIDWILDSAVEVTSKGGENKTQIEPGNVAPYTALNPDETETLTFTYSGLLTDPMFRAVLHAIEKSGKARTLSVPRVTTVNNHQATIHVGQRYPYFTRFTTVRDVVGYDSNGNAIYDDSLVPEGDPVWEDLGITLHVTPSVGADMRSITLSLYPSIKDKVSETVYRVSGGSSLSDDTNETAMVWLPIFEERKILTKLIVGSGETVVMGGLIRSDESQSERRVPILGSLPLLGRFFRHDSVSETKENLLIFVTATILSERGENLIPITRQQQKVSDAEPPAQPEEP
ncbi:MAG: hypothetical protein R6V03_05300 [Kiritimatiellia bacterium]